MSIYDRITLYTLVRSLRPKVCIETGAAGGCSSTYILGALKRNGKGSLYSIDIQSTYAPFYGELIPERLRDGWILKIQESSPILPAILEELKSIDFFLHDSRHTFRHMLWEYQLAWSHLGSGGCLASHDILTTTAFRDFSRVHSDEIIDCGGIGNLGFFIKK